ncbi:MAG: S8 family serine peptidase [Bacteroidetes bacterium]|nr:S8 family serine peptidase [Bacteroidota bacterium]
MNVTTYPADINDVQVISVGGSGDEGEYDAGTIIADDDGANYGGNIDIIAPYGMETLVYTLDNTDSESYTDFDGTSGSAPHVSGVAALMASYVNNPDGESHIENIAPEHIENILQLTADDAGLLALIGTVTLVGV